MDFSKAVQVYKSQKEWNKNVKYIFLIDDLKFSYPLSISFNSR